MTYLVSFVNQLMRSSNKFKTIHMIEFGRNFIPKEPTSSTRRYSPGIHFFRVTPNEIAESTFMGNFLSTGDHSNLIHCSDFRTQASVYTQNLAINHSCKNQEIENLAARLPYRGIAIFLLTLFVESINLCDLTGFMVATDKCNLVGISFGISFCPLLVIAYALTMPLSTSIT